MLCAQKALIRPGRRRLLFGFCHKPVAQQEQKVGLLQHKAGLLPSGSCHCQTLHL